MTKIIFLRVVSPHKKKRYWEMFITALEDDLKGCNERPQGKRLDSLQNKIYGILFHMNYKNSETLNEIRFKRLVGVKRSTFHAMLNVLTIEYQLLHAKGGRKPKLKMEDLLMATRRYLREYRTYEQIAADFGIHETSFIRRSHWAEETLVRHGFSIGKRAVAQGETLLVDATEVRIPRSKKTTPKLFCQEKKYPTVKIQALVSVLLNVSKLKMCLPS